jgi:hypothetical protein
MNEATTRTIWAAVSLINTEQFCDYPLSVEEFDAIDTLIAAALELAGWRKTTGGHDE